MKHIDLLHLCQIINLEIFDDYADAAFNSIGVPLSSFVDSKAHLVNEDSLEYNSANRYYFDQYNFIKKKHTISENYQLLDIVTYNDLYHIQESYETSGFLGVIFRNINTDDLIVVFRSTDAELDDVMTDLDIGLWGTIALQQICAYRLISSRLDLYKTKKTKKLYLTGHSLGGALAQFAYLTYKNDIKDVECITFNNLGVGYSYIKNNLNKFMSKVPSTLIDPYIHTKLPDYDENDDCIMPLHGIIKNDIIKLVNQDNPLGIVCEKEIGSFKLQFGFGDWFRNNAHPVKPIDLSLPVDAYSRLYADFIYIKRHLKRLLENDDQLNLRSSKSYILSTDWVPCINEQLGYTIILDQNPSIGYINYKYNISYKGLKKFGFKYHGLHLFKPFLDNKGYFIK